MTILLTGVTIIMSKKMLLTPYNIGYDIMK